MTYHGDDDNPPAIAVAILTASQLLRSMRPWIGSQSVYFGREAILDATVEFLEGARGRGGKLDPISHGR
ncbi:MAG: hypothetical protein HYZ74_00760 [Elusimicrobia bacterium]|nr:hypothetical protein [Elusimicrobiota bacterium]